MTYTIHYFYENRKEYYPLNSAWAGNLIAINAMQNDLRIKEAWLVNNETGEIEKTFIR